ncbi:hypothetical protein [Blastopirellula marina]|uniref:Uncharacterized protein n=1 Tax=Blastopirellula marina TaxID=124 RepID=A0A2S8F4A5_9BACT|nr:hypothetical protein [Blastopirellula marina]PQO26983.1 hypothetical protein C5Y98_27380 [Blastopirellula marina]PTL41130.1 hypothetical protein C5Y97_27395 [Blastopirellula marina]
MKFHIRLRTLMVVVALIALGCGWYAAHAYQRQKEVTAIRRIQDAGYQVHIQESFSKTQVTKIFQPGVRVWLKDETPSFLRFHANTEQWDAFQRVSSIYIQGGFDPNLVESIGEFARLETLEFAPWAISPGGPSSEVDVCMQRFRQFAERHPGLTLRLPPAYSEAQ